MNRPLSYQPTQFVPARGLASPHAQTLFAYARRFRSGLPLRRERWETPDGDFVDVDFLEAPAAAPHLFVLHGLEGSSRAGYVTSLLLEARRRGWGVAAFNFRSCSGELNRLARSYHSGETLDARFALELLRPRLRGPIFGVGFSLGANVLLRLLETLGDDAPLDAAAAVSTPYDLQGAARAIDTGGGPVWLYREAFLRTLKQKSLIKAERFPGTIDAARLRTVRRLQAFDDAVTAPVHGFTDARDYYAQSSSGPHLHAIRRPTLLLSSMDDPIVPAAASIPAGAESHPQLSVVRTQQGGHCGFVGGNALQPHFWAEAEVARFFDAVMKDGGPSRG